MLFTKTNTGLTTRFSGPTACSIREKSLCHYYGEPTSNLEHNRNGETGQVFMYSRVLYTNHSILMWPTVPMLHYAPQVVGGDRTTDI